MSLENYLGQILGELGRTLASLKDADGEGVVRAIAAAQRIFVAGAGRSGLAMKSFAMRLMHLGLTTHVVGETTTPGIGEGDLLLIGSGSGATSSLVGHARRARDRGTRIGLITILPDSPIGQLADVVVALPAPTSKVEGDLGFSSMQPMGSLFEQSLLLTLDAIVLLLMDQGQIDPEAMFDRHANLE